jgi:hypothetical protein
LPEFSNKIYLRGRTPWPPKLAFALWQALEPTIETQRPQEVIVISGALAESDRTI